MDRAAEGVANQQVEALERGGHGRARRRGGLGHQRRVRGRRQRRRQVGGQEHVVRLDGRAEEERAQRDERQAQAANQRGREEGVGVVVLAQDVEDAAVKGGLDVVELIDVAVLDPVDDHLAANDNEKGRQHLDGRQPRRQDREAGRQDRRVVQRHLGGHVLEQAAGPQVEAGARHRQAANLDDVAQGNDEQHDPQLEPLDNVGARQLERVFLFRALEHAALDLDKLVRHEQRQQRVRVRVDGHVERNHLVEEHRRVRNVVHERQAEHAKRQQDLGPPRRRARQRLRAEQALKDVLPERRQQPVADLDQVVDDVQLDRRLRPHKVVHAAGVQVHERERAAHNHGALQQVGLVERRQVRRHRLGAPVAPEPLARPRGHFCTVCLLCLCLHMASAPRTVRVAHRAAVAAAAWPSARRRRRHRLWLWLPPSPPHPPQTPPYICRHPPHLLPHDIAPPPHQHARRNAEPQREDRQRPQPRVQARQRAKVHGPLQVRRQQQEILEPLKLDGVRLVRNVRRVRVVDVERARPLAGQLKLQQRGQRHGRQRDRGRDGRGQAVFAVAGWQVCGRVNGRLAVGTQTQLRGRPQRRRGAACSGSYSGSYTGRATVCIQRRWPRGRVLRVPACPCIAGDRRRGMLGALSCRLLEMLLQLLLCGSRLATAGRRCRQCAERACRVPVPLHTPWFVRLTSCHSSSRLGIWAIQRRAEPAPDGLSYYAARDKIAVVGQGCNRQ
ncbi:uncharacterized protein SPSK_05031 [Sporothrix schenckii 1099-18]|uniref:Uncharacterized protein n=1 Tax=Sporothrix schenckii 1099-18 TaxID=1397361 RepID=A0A0F2LTW6_SPOSC|nr:uncharacterized protein SPSK_05031 [Sporothrix schenckii 1099-18]KJR80299.1 hypothetical protein SPSK_05031 [Sporothrix schenckii 1099-18]